LWDSSALVSGNSIGGSILHSLVGYEPRPAGMQIVFYVIVLVSIAAGMKFLGRSTRPTPRGGSAN
jgi:high-affinity iron transporter